MALARATMYAEWGIWFAVVIRVALGIALIAYAPYSRFPVIFEIVGWISLIAAIVAVLLGRDRLRKFVVWWLERFTPWGIRLWLVIALAFGGFLIYGAV